MSDESTPPEDHVHEIEELEGGSTRPDVAVPESRGAARPNETPPSAPPRESSSSGSQSSARIPSPPPLPAPRTPSSPGYVPPRPGFTPTGTTANRLSAPAWGDDPTRPLADKTGNTGETALPRYGRSVAPKPATGSSPIPGTGSRVGLPPRPPAASSPPRVQSGVPPRPATSIGSTSGAPSPRSAAAPPRPSGVPPRPSSPPQRAQSVPPPLRPSGVPPRPGDTGSTLMPGSDRERIARLTAQLQGERDRIAKNESEISSMSSRLNLLDERVGELEEEVRGDASAAPKAASSNIGELEKRIDDLENVAKKVRAGDSALREILEQQQKTVDERNATVAGLEGRVAELEKALGAREADLARAVDKLDAAVAEIASLRERLDAAPTAPEGNATKPYVAPSRTKAAKPTATPAADANGEDDLKAIKGIGPKFEKALKKLGVVRYAQIAAWSEADLEGIAEKLGTRPQRIQKDGWIEAAKKLVSDS